MVDSLTSCFPTPNDAVRGAIISDPLDGVVGSTVCDYSKSLIIVNTEATALLAVDVEIECLGDSSL